MIFSLLRKRVALWPTAFMVLVGVVVSLLLLLRSPREEVKKFADLPEIMMRKQLIAVVHPSTINYFIYKAEPSGFQYEMLQTYAQSMGLKLTIIPVRSVQEGYDLLLDGRADVVASDLLVGAPGSVPGVFFSMPYLFTRHVLVQKKPRNWRSLSKSQLEKNLVRNVSKLGSRRVYAPGWSVLLADEKSLPGMDIKIHRLQGIDPERIMEMVSRGDMEYGVVGEHVATALSRSFPNVDVSTILSGKIPLGWAVRDSSVALLYSINVWMSKYIHTSAFAGLYRKYHTGRRISPGASTRNYSIPLGAISPFDKHLKVYSSQIGWDWRLVASLMYQESRFDPLAHSRSGAYGLMQMMPQTLRRYGLDSMSVAEQQIRAGIKYLRVMEKLFLKSVPDQDERVKFVLASYNIGAGHILDAQRLAKHFGKDPSVWDGNVDTCLLMKANPKVFSLPEVRNGYCRGKETFAFVREVMDRYRHYTNIVKR